MGWFGRKTRSDSLWDSMSSVSTMVGTFRKSGSLVSSRRQAGVIFKPDDSIPFLMELDGHLNEILYEGEGATKTAYDLVDDDHGMRWVILDDGNFDDLLSSAFTIANAMKFNGAGGNLLAAVFNLDFAGGVVEDRSGAGAQFLQSYLIFRFDRNSYYPFIPTGDAEGSRDREVEQKLGGVMRSHGLKTEDSLSQWLGLWGIPF